MWFRQLVREETGCASYVIGSSSSDACVVVDPLWDIEPYVAVAAARGARIVAAIDTHSHADHVSGCRRLASLTGAELCLPEGADITYPARRLRDGEHLSLGEVDLEILHVPGHRPEQINVLVRDLERSPEPWCLLTGDFLMVGDLSRSDLAQSGEDGAATLFDVSLPRLLSLPDHVEVYPGHVAGST